MISLLLLTIFLPPILTDDDFISTKCESQFIYLKCECKERENFDIPPILNDMIKRIKIIGCSSVSIQFASLKNLLIEELEFRNIERLHFEHFALNSVKDVNTIKIENVQDLVFETYATKGMKEIKHFVIKDSYINVLKSESFSYINNITYMLIENVTINSIEEFAFNIKAINTLQVKNSRFQNVTNNSIYIHDSRETLFENCEFLESVNNTFGFDTVDSLTFQGCAFGDLATTFIHSRDIEKLTFTNCTFGEIMPGAFSATEVLEKVSFKNNSVKNAYPDSLSLFMPDNHTIESEFCCNYFPCNCSMYWIWEYDVYRHNKSVLESSLCIDNPTKDIFMYVPVMDSITKCSELDLKETKSSSLPSNETSNLPDMISLTVKGQGVSQLLNPFVLSFCLSCLMLLNKQEI